MRVELLELAAIEEHGQARARIDPVVMPTFWANLQVILQRLAPDDLAAVLTLEPQPFGFYLALALFRLQGCLLSREPSHSNSVWHSRADPGTIRGRTNSLGAAGIRQFPGPAVGQSQSGSRPPDMVRRFAIPPAIRSC